MLTRRSFIALAAAVPALGRRHHGPRRRTRGLPAVALRSGAPIPSPISSQGAPVQGDAAFATDWMGARWTFASAANRDAFVAEPERYAPAFGGYCAFAASRGYVAPTIPEAWSIHEDRLYLNANLRARELWLAELPTVIAAGEANWPGILG
jgi:YHS domain-containing protein